MSMNDSVDELVEEFIQAMERYDSAPNRNDTLTDSLPIYAKLIQSTDDDEQTAMNVYLNSPMGVKYGRFWDVPKVAVPSDLIQSMIDSGNIILTDDGEDHPAYAQIRDYVADFNKTSRSHDWRTVYSAGGFKQLFTGNLDLTPVTVTGDNDDMTYTFHRARGACYDCAASISLGVRGNHLHMSSSEKCTHNSVTKVTIDFPSGVVAIGDWLPCMNKAREEGHFFIKDRDVNEISQTVATSHDWAAFNVLHTFVGNTSPNVMLHSDGSLYITNEYGNDDYVDDEDEVVPPTDNHEYTKLGHVSTDLWWVTMYDWEFLSKLLENMGIDPESVRDEYEFITIPAGKYEFTCNTIVQDIDGVEQNYAKAVRIGDSDEYNGELPKLATRFYSVDEVISRYYMRNRMRVADYLFNSIGGIGDLADVRTFISTRADEPVVPFVERIEMQFKPYPNFSEAYSLLWRAPDAIKFMPIEFVELGLDFYTASLEFFIDGGVGYHHGYDPDDSYCKNTVEGLMETFLVKYKGDVEEFNKAYTYKTAEGSPQYDGGDMATWWAARWHHTRLNRLIPFCQKAIDILNAEITSRYA